MKSKAGKIALIIILSIICIILIGIMVIALINGKNGINIKLFSYQTELIYEKEVGLEEINDLRINMTSSDVNVKESTDGKIKINVYGAEEEKVIEKFENSILEITKENNSIILFGMWSDNRVDIYIPKDYEKELHINTSSGDINVIDLEKANITIKAGSGDITCGNIMNGNIQTSSGDIEVGKSNEINLKASSGDIKIGDSVKVIAEASSGTIKTGFTEEAEIKTSSGEIEVNSAKRIVAESTSGDINIDVVDGYSKIKSTSGKVEIGSYNITENSEIETTSGEVSLVNNSNIYFEAESNSGDIDIKENNRLSEIVCKIKTTSGNIDVE